MKISLVTVLYLLLLLSTHNSPASDVAYFGVLKIQRLEQITNAAPTVISNGYAFQSFVFASSSLVVTSATVKPSNSTPLRTLTPDLTTLLWQFEETFPTQEAADATYPISAGLLATTYQMTIGTVNDGTHTSGLKFIFLIIPLSYPSTPQISNWKAAQSIDHTADFNLSWNDLGGSTLAIVQLQIFDASSNVVFSTPAPFQTGSLNGSSTQVTIPAFTLPPGETLSGHLTIANPGNPDTNSYPGALGIPALTKDTGFTLVTRPAPANPQLAISKTNSNAKIQLTGETNRIYHLEVSSNLLNWTNILNTNSVSGMFEFVEPASKPYRFYRGRVGQ